MEKWNDIVEALKNAGIDAYPPAYRTGICTSPYCVVQQCTGKRASAKRSGSAKYRIHILVPADEYPTLSEMGERVREALLPLVESGSLRECITRSTTIVDNVFAAHSCYVEYASEYTV